MQRAGLCFATLSGRNIQSSLFDLARAADEDKRCGRSATTPRANDEGYECQPARLSGLCGNTATVRGFGQSRSFHHGVLRVCCCHFKVAAVTGIPGPRRDLWVALGTESIWPHLNRECRGTIR
ncbi:hypothetical protein MRX96_004970 [Rhipicephalus microplus]